MTDKKTIATIFDEVPYASPLYDEMVSLRDVVLRQPLGLTFHKKDMAAEYDQHHFGLYDTQHRLLGCLVLKPVDAGDWQMRQVAVASHSQGRGFGRMMIQRSLHWLRDRGARRVEAAARAEVLPFYQSMDFEPVGSPYEHLGIVHQHVVYSM